MLEVGDLVRFHAARLDGAEAGEVSPASYWSILSLVINIINNILSKERSIRYLATGLIAEKTPDKLKRMKFPGDLDHVVSLEQVCYLIF